MGVTSGYSLRNALVLPLKKSEYYGQSEHTVLSAVTPQSNHTRTGHQGQAGPEDQALPTIPPLVTPQQLPSAPRQWAAKSSPGKTQ